MEVCRLLWNAVVEKPVWCGPPPIYQPGDPPVA
jgi:hypothetical protein